MKNQALADWLEHCLEFTAQIEDPLCSAIVEGFIQTAATGQTDLLASVLNGAARNTVARERSLEAALTSLHAAKEVLWERLELEFDPLKIWDMLTQLEALFQSALLILAEAHHQTIQESSRRRQAESARLSREAENKVMAYASQLAKTNRELARIEKAKTDFISIAAHELKTPLTILKGYIDMILEQEGVLSIGSENLIITGIAPGTFNGISAGINRLTTIVDDLLDISTLETNSLIINPEPVAPDNLVAIAVDQMKEMARSRDLQFELRLDPVLPVIQSDPKQLHQVFTRLLNNAVRYTPDGGKITVLASVKRKKDGSRCLEFEITDTGIGIAPEDKEHIFNKFYRVGEVNLHSSGSVKFRGAGPGLGLSIAKGIVEALNGRIWVESQGCDELNCPGSSFFIQLPAPDEDTPEPPEPTEPTYSNRPAPHPGYWLHE